MTDSDMVADLRSSYWFSDSGKNGFIHRSWLKGEGIPDEVFDGRPVIGIANTWSQTTPCNSNLRRLAATVARGVWEAGGFPLEFPVMSIGETLMRPTSMLFRNLMAMEVEEQLRANPFDAVALLGGCDKTLPGLLMGAASADLPTLVLSSGPKLTGKFRGTDVGSGSDLWRFHDEVRTGAMAPDDFLAAERCMARSEGHCMTMASASTMAVLSEVMGLQMPGASTVPAADSNRLLFAHLTGRRAVELARQGVSMSSVVTRGTMENAVKVLAAIGGSTNAVLHLIALSGRLELGLTLDDWNGLTSDIPLLLNLQPSGKYLMEDFYYAGGAPALLRELLPLLAGDEKAATGRTLAEEVKEAECWNREVIATLDRPFKGAGSGIAVLKGNLCPDGAIIKQAAASPSLLRHRGRALVFDTIEELEKAIDDEALDIDADSVLVLRNSGPRGYPGMPEVGNLPVPKKLLLQGITDIVRLSDARMSGSSFGTVVLHIAPEAAVGGPIGILQTGDWIRLDVPARTLQIEVSDEELAKRQETKRTTILPLPERGYLRLHHEHVLQADRGADLDFLIGKSGNAVPRQPF